MKAKKKRDKKDLSLKILTIKIQTSYFIHDGIWVLFNWNSYNTEQNKNGSAP